MYLDKDIDDFLFDGYTDELITDIKPIKVKKELTIKDLDAKVDGKVIAIKRKVTMKSNDLAKVDEERKYKPVTDRDIEARIYLWMIDGYTTKRIIDELYKVGIKTEHTARRLIGNVNRSCSAVTKQDMEELRVRYIEMYSDLYGKAIGKKDYATARNILDSVVKLQGLVIKKVEGKVVENFTVEF